MSHPLRRVLILVAIGALSISAFADSGRRRAAAPGSSQPPAATRPSFQQDQLEYYMSEDGIAYIRPGAKITLVSITNVAPGQKPVVEIKLTDSLDQPLDRLGKVTPGPFAPGFILAKWDAPNRDYITITTRTRSGVTNPSADQNGQWTDLELGRYKYTFGTAMPANLDTAATYTLGIYGRRTLSDIIGKDYYADNIFKDFRPDGGTPTATFGAMDASNTCNNCHNPLGLHGGTRRTPKNCALCHNSQVKPDATSGESFQAKVMMHKLHRSPNLPSVKAGKPYMLAGDDFSHITYPQDLRNCTTCHDPKAPEADIWYTRPSRAACGSCHDDINFATGENHGHVGQQIPAQKDDTQCAKCHIPDSGQEFDTSIKGAHVIPEKSKQLKGLSSTIVSFTDMVPGKKPTVVFSLKNADGTAVDGSKLTTFSPILAGKSASYSKYFRENAVGKATFDATTGYTTYTFTNPIPEDATGSWTLSADIYRNVVLKRQDGQPEPTMREAAFNPIKTVAVSGTMEPRRQVVTMDNCNKCHDRLALHGGQRLMIQECVICHNPTADDQAQRVAAEGKPESISFQYMVHRIHKGEALKNDFTVKGFNKSTHNYNEVLFPGDLRDCAKCHVSNSHREGLGDPVKTERALFSPMGPTTAACLGCHDSNDAQAHAYLNTATFGTKSQEACGACHDPGSEWSADRVHAR